MEDKGSFRASRSIPTEREEGSEADRLEKAEAELSRLRNAKWSDLSDAELGRCFKAFAESVEQQSAKDWGGDAEMRLGLMQMGLFQAIKMAAESNAETFSFTAEGFHSEGRQLGDWTVTIARADAAEAPDKLAGYEAEGRMNQDRSLT